jgi:hypothetical protein
MCLLAGCPSRLVAPRWVRTRALAKPTVTNRVLKQAIKTNIDRVMLINLTGSL